MSPDISYERKLPEYKNIYYNFPPEFFWLKLAKQSSLLFFFVKKIIYYLEERDITCASAGVGTGERERIQAGSR